MLTQKNVSYIKLFISASGVRLVCCMSPHLNILCTISIREHYAKIRIKFNYDIQFLHIFHLKFRINANIVYIPVEMKFSISTVCSNDHGQYF